MASSTPSTPTPTSSVMAAAANNDNPLHLPLTSPTASSVCTLTSRSQHDTRFVHNIRLWGREGQEALEGSHILALGCTAVACQAVKNLVLPGAGNFTIVDDRRVTAEDAQTNFFLSSADERGGYAGSPAALAAEVPLAEAAAHSLADLHRKNAETGGVDGFYILQNPNVFITSPDTSGIRRLSAEGGGSAGAASAEDIDSGSDANPFSPIHAAGGDPSSSSYPALASPLATFLKRQRVNVILVSATCVSEGSIGRLAACIEAAAAAEEAQQARQQQQQGNSSSSSSSFFFRKMLVLVLHISGYIGAIRMASVADATIVQSVLSKDHTFDTRYSDPFPALREWMDAHAPHTVPAAEATRVPYFVLAYHALKAFTAKRRQGALAGEGDNATDNNGSLRLVVPDSREEWQEAQRCLVDDVLAKCLVEELCGDGDGNEGEGEASSSSSPSSQPKTRQVVALDSQDEVVEEALLLLTRAKGDLKARSFPELRRVWARADELLSDPSTAATAGLFWFVALAIRTFWERSGGNLPLSAEVPDFHTNSAWYRELVALYKAEGRREASEVAGYAAALLQAHGRAATASPSAELEALCVSMVPNARYLASTRYVPLSAEYASAGPSAAVANGVKLSYSPEEAYHCPCGFYVALKVGHAFASAEGRFPGACPPADAEAYAADQRAVAAKYASNNADFHSSSSSSDVIDTDCNWVTSPEAVMGQIEEVVRGGGAELMTTAAIVGALAAQEVIKFVMQRYVPSGSLIVFDGHESLGHSVEVTPLAPKA